MNRGRQCDNCCNFSKIWSRHFSRIYFEKRRKSTKSYYFDHMDNVRSYIEEKQSKLQLQILPSRQRPSTQTTAKIHYSHIEFVSQAPNSSHQTSPDFFQHPLLKIFLAGMRFQLNEECNVLSLSLGNCL